MGNAISESNALQASAQQQLHGKERFAYEQLRMMEKMAAQQLDRYETEARSSASQTGNNNNNKVRFERSVRIDASAEPHHVDKLVEDFFAGSQNSPAVLDSYKAVVRGSLHDVLEDETQGEVTDEKFFLCSKNDALVRVDVYAYRFNFPTESLAFRYRNVVAYLLGERAVDAQQTTTSEVMAQITECSRHIADADAALRDTYMDATVAAWKRQRTSGLAGSVLGARPGSTVQNPMAATMRSMMN